MSGSQRFSQIDAFTDRPFSGNPAAVCVLPAPRDAGWMQQVASEMNLAETAFLVRRADGFDLRWFTPAAEVDLCGNNELAGYQASSRGGTVLVRVAGDRVHLGGQAVTVLRGELLH